MPINITPIANSALNSHSSLSTVTILKLLSIIMNSSSQIRSLSQWLLFLSAFDLNARRIVDFKFLLQKLLPPVRSSARFRTLEYRHRMPVRYSVQQFLFLMFKSRIRSFAQPVIGQQRFSGAIFQLNRVIALVDGLY